MVGVSVKSERRGFRSHLGPLKMAGVSDSPKMPGVSDTPGFRSHLGTLTKQAYQIHLALGPILAPQSDSLTKFHK